MLGVQGQEERKGNTQLVSSNRLSPIRFEVGLRKRTAPFKKKKITALNNLRNNFHHSEIQLKDAFQLKVHLLTVLRK